MGQKLSAYLPEDNDPWFRPNLRTKEYGDFGDAYSDDIYDSVSGKWALEHTPGPAPGCVLIPQKAIVSNIIGPG